MGAVRGLTLLPVLGFPLIAHFSAVKAVYWPVLLCCALWLLLLALRPSFSPFTRALLLGGSLLPVAALGHPGLGELLLPLPSLLIFLLLAYAFGVTLRPGSRPLVTRIAAALGDPLEEDLLRYTRQVTLAWCGLFLLLAGMSMVLWLLGTREQWSVFSNFIAYALLLLMFALEYLLRYRRFAFERERGVLGFMRALAGIRPRVLWQ